METQNSLPFFKTKLAVNEALSVIDRERSGKQYGLFSRYPKLNRSVNRYFRFKQIILIAGMSGSGKSYFLNMLRSDFLSRKNISYGNIKDNKTFNLGKRKVPVTFINSDYKVCAEDDDNIVGYLYLDSRLLVKNDGEIISKGTNKDCEYDVIGVHFGYEMPAESELIRSASNVMGKSYGYIISSDYDKKTNSYNKITNIQYEEIKKVLKTFSSRKEYYVSFSGNVEQFKNTCYRIQEKHKSSKLVITLDHLLLSKYLKEKTEADLQASLASAAIELKQRIGALIIYLNQMNQNIESLERVTSKSGHFPTKKDIYLGGKIFWACDTVFIVHRPGVLGIEQYGLYSLRTKDLIHLRLVKNRDGILGDIFFRADFKHGRIHESDLNYFKK